MGTSLVSARHSPPPAEERLRILNNRAGRSPQRPFDDALAASGLHPLAATGIEIFQVNAGKLCNQTCKHCHVDAGPDRTEENMTRETFELCLDAIRRLDRPKVDITGGAPELNPNFRWFVEQVRGLGCHVMDRCNLTVLTLRSQSGLAEFLARNRVEVIASLPYFSADRTDAQRGGGIFEKSIEALQKLNGLGYGQPGSGLALNLVYNPTGAFLPPPQQAIEADFRRELKKRHGIVFQSLYVITNMPISRFLDFLMRSGNYERYMNKLIAAYNPPAAAGVMCRNTLSIGWDGALYDCDFNQMLELGTGFGAPRHIRDFDPAQLARRRIVTGQHCYGCTAGAGSSCGGVTAGKAADAGSG